MSVVADKTPRNKKATRSLWKNVSTMGRARNIFSSSAFRIISVSSSALGIHSGTGFCRRLRSPERQAQNKNYSSLATVSELRASPSANSLTYDDRWNKDIRS